MADKREKVYYQRFCHYANHFHLIWKISDGLERKNVQGALFSFTAHEFKKELKKSNAELLEDHFVNKADSSFQFWEREPMIKECRTKNFFRQKLNYIHFNPCQPHWNLAEAPENYKYSSAKFYETGIRDFEFVTHFNDF
jgi:putative transposase